MGIAPDAGLPVVTAPIGEARIKQIGAAAARRYAETGDAEAAMSEMRERLARSRSA